MKGSADYAIVYDITDDRERSKIDQVLKNFGFRVQKSVFECRLNKRSHEELLEQLRNLEVKTGFIKLYRLEHGSLCVVIGEPPKDNPDEGNVFIV